MTKRFSVRRFYPWLGAGLLLALVVTGFSYQRVKPLENAPAFSHASLDIQRADGQKFPFDIEVATTDSQIEHGLMHRHSLPANAGMLFLFDPEQVVGFWMKDTPISLDMLFVRGDGTIAKIITHAEPFSPEPLTSDLPVRGVLEVNAGTVRQLGLTTGDRLLYPAFSEK